MKGDQMEEIKFKQYFYDSLQLLTAEVGNSMFKGERKVKIEKIEIHVWAEGSDEPVIVGTGLVKFEATPQLYNVIAQEEKGDQR